MTRSLRYYLGGLVALSAFALVATSLFYASRQGWVAAVNPAISIGSGEAAPAKVFLGLAFWTVLTLASSALPIRMPRGTLVGVGIAPLVATMILAGPAAAGWVAAIGTTEIRELRGRIPWYGTLANHAGIVVPAIAGGMLMEFLRGASPDPVVGFLSAFLGAALLFALNIFFGTALLALRSGQGFRVVAAGDARGFAINLFALAPLGWLMALIYQQPGGAGWWGTLILTLPLYTTRLTNRQFVEMREMFTQTISSLAQAVDKRDKFTSGHSLRVKEIAVDIGRVMRVSDADLEALEWGGLLHDVGKIGVPDNVLLKQERLTKEERMIMNAHPVLGAEIIAPVTKLAPELPIIRHHHEWYNGSGYPDRLMGQEIPKLARILHVADAFEAMTAARPYRMKPLTAEQALSELRKFAGIQFDPVVVDAFVRTRWAEDVADSGRERAPRPVPLISQAAARAAEMTPFPGAGTPTDIG